MAHRDLKLENLLLDKDQNLKIADFGLSNLMEDGASLKTSCGSPDYAAPEIIEHVPYDGVKVDAWSSGVILYAMLYGQLPFDGQNRSLMFRKVISGDFQLSDEVAIISDTAKDLIRRLLDPNPVSRVSPQQALHHSWLHEPSDTSESYLADYERFVASQRLNLKPKSAKDVDQSLVA